MGAFFLFKKDQDTDSIAVQTLFLERGFRPPLIRNLGSHTLYLYQKTLMNLSNHCETDQGAIYVTGTLAYKKKSYADSLNSILLDFLDGSLEFSRLFGSYAILIHAQGRIHLITDPAGTYNIYHDEKGAVVSSSFLALLYANPSKAEINKMAAVEILTTGNLMGPDTLIESIQRFLIRFPAKLPGIDLIEPNYLEEISYCRKSYAECQDEQIDVLEKYFRSIKHFADDYGISSGITDGLDSRLLLILIIKHLDKFQFFSTRRKLKTHEFQVAEQLTQAIGHPLRSIPFTDQLDMDEAQAASTLERTFLFYDGHIRAHHLWTEEINTRSYREKLLGNKRICMSGIGGEQYRNQERMILPRRSFLQWIEADLQYRYSGDCFRTKQNKNDFFDYLGTKIKIRLNLSHQNRIDHLHVKRYLNEIYNPANRATRMNIENQIAFFLSPFTEYFLSQQAYRALPHLGAYIKFEADLISRLSPSLAAIETHYCKDLAKAESVNMILMTYAIEFLPKKILYRLHLKRRSSSHFYARYENRFPFIEDLTKGLADMDLPVEINKLKAQPHVSPLIIAMGYFFNRIGHKVKP